MTNDNNPFDYDDFMHYANGAYLLHPEHQRYGQFLMNHLTQHHPDIVVPDEVDCFYDDKKVPKFMRYIHTLSQGESRNSGCATCGTGTLNGHSVQNVVF